MILEPIWLKQAVASSDRIRKEIDIRTKALAQAKRAQEEANLKKNLSPIDCLRVLRHAEEKRCLSHNWEHTWITKEGEETQCYWDGTAKLRTCINCDQRRVELFDEDGW
jgi:hypothetical protein